MQGGRTLCAWFNVPNPIWPIMAHQVAQCSNGTSEMPLVWHGIRVFHTGFIYHFLDYPSWAQPCSILLTVTIYHKGVKSEATAYGTG